MRLCTGQSRVEFALLSGSGATSGATDTKGLFLLGFHDSIMQGSPITRWSILTSALTSTPGENFMAILIFACELSCSDAKAHSCHSRCTECVDGAANADSPLLFTGRCQSGRKQATAKRPHPGNRRSSSVCAPRNLAAGHDSTLTSLELCNYGNTSRRMRGVSPRNKEGQKSCL